MTAGTTRSNIMAKPKVTAELKTAKTSKVTETIEATEAPMVSEPAEAEVTTEAVEASEEKTTKAGKRSAKAIREADEEAARVAKAEDRKASEEASEEAPKHVQTKPNPINAHGKKFRAAKEKVEAGKEYELAEALKLAQSTSTVKFDATVEMHLNLGVDPKQADQMVRGTVTLPAGTGKTLKIAIFANEEKQKEAKAAGADIVGNDKLLADIEAGKINFDVIIATPDMMAQLAKVAKVLGPKGLMPNPKSGTVTANVASAVKEMKLGKVEFRIDKQGIIHQPIGKVSFKEADLLSNAKTLISAILKAKPTGAKGTYLLAIAVSSSMGPGIKVSTADVASQR
jgi:large subunit ribosomal protein L1